jgi:YD repeat-containing protein
MYDSLAFLTKKTTGSLEQNYIFDHLTGNLLSRGRGTLSETFQYNHPGSLVALRNTNGTVAESYSYDAWGRRGDMNGRVYDPVTAGFLSPDPFVANPYFSQSYNRYSYRVNNLTEISTTRLPF